MALFHSFLARDVVEVEPVYFPEGPSLSPKAEKDLFSPNARTKPPTPRPRYQRTFPDTLLHRLTERYVGKVLPGRGLCVAVQEVLHYTRSFVRGPSASAWVTAEFRLCVFVPSIGARMRATILAQNGRGIFLSLDFFQFVLFVPGASLVPMSFFEERHKRWVLRVEEGEENAGDDAAPSALNAYENGEEVIVKVERVMVRNLVDYHGTLGAKDAMEATSAAESYVPIYAETPASTPPPPMEVIGTFIGTGLGPVAWFE